MPVEFATILKLEISANGSLSIITFHVQSQFSFAWLSLVRH